MKSIIEESYSANVRFGKIEKVTRKEYYEVDFNEKGNKVEKIRYKSDGSISSKNTYDYDVEGIK